MTPALGLPLVGACLLLQGFFSGSEMALVSANRALLHARADEGHAGATLALYMLEHDEDRLLGTCLIGTNLCLIGGTTLFGLVMIQQGVPQEWLQTMLYVPLGLVIGEAVPKLVYRHYSDALAPVLARPIRMRAIQVLFAPGLWVVTPLGASPAAAACSGPPKRPAVRREDIVQPVGRRGRPDRPRETAR